MRIFRLGSRSFWKIFEDYTELSNHITKLESVPWDTLCINVILSPSSKPKISLRRTGDIPFCVLKGNGQAISQAEV